MLSMTSGVKGVKATERGVEATEGERQRECRESRGKVAEKGNGKEEEEREEEESKINLKFKAYTTLRKDQIQFKEETC
jgi:hypothetical protein